MKCSTGITNFLEEISSLFHSIVFLYFFTLITEEVFFSLCAILWNSAFKSVYLSFSPLPFAYLPFSAIGKASSDNNFAFLHFFFLSMVLMIASCTMSQTSVYSSSGTLFMFNLISCQVLNCIHALTLSFNLDQEKKEKALWKINKHLQSRQRKVQKTRIRWRGPNQLWEN